MLVTDETSGWSNPSGFHLVFDYEHDNLGNAIKVPKPADWSAEGARQ